MSLRLSRSMDAQRLPRLGENSRNMTDGEHDDGVDISGDFSNDLKSPAARLEKWHKITDVGGKLQKLDLTNCSLNSHSASPVAELFTRQKQHVKQVLLRDNPALGPEAVKYLLSAFENAPVLTTLNLRNTGLVDDCVSSLIKSMYLLPHLSDVNLANNNFTEEGAELFAAYLQSNTSIKRLSFAHNKIRDRGAQEFAKALEVNTGLLFLDLAACRIADCGAVQLGLMLATNASLTHLDLCRNPISEDGVDAFAEVIQRNTTLLQVALTGVEKIYVERIAQVCRRNKSFVGDMVPHKLDKEMQRLYVQQHKLEVANQQLRELHAETARIQEQLKSIDTEFEMEKQDINTKAKKVVEVIDFTTVTIQELQRKYKELQAQALREKETKEAEADAANDKWEAACREREALETRAEELHNQHQRLLSERHSRVEHLQRKIADCQEEHLRYKEQQKSTQSRMAEVTRMIEELERQRGSKAA